MVKQQLQTARIMQLIIVTPDGVMANQQVSTVSFIADTSGAMEVLPGHESMVVGIKDGDIRYVSNGMQQHVTVSDAMAHITHQQVVINAITATKNDSHI